MKTYRLCGATQRHFPPPCLVPFAACAKPGLSVIDGGGLSPLLAKTRGRKVRVWVARATVSMETDGLEIVGGWTAEGKLNRKVQHDRATKRAGPNTWLLWGRRTGIIQLIDTFTAAGGTK